MTSSLRSTLLVSLALAASGCVTLLGSVHQPIFREMDSPAGKPAQYEIANLDFSGVWVDEKPLDASPSRALFEEGTTKANERYRAAVGEAIKSDASAPWVIKTLVRRVETDRTTGFNDPPHNGMHVQVSIVERGSGRVVERFICQGGGGRTGYSYAVSGAAIGVCVATVLTKGSMKGGK